MIVLYTINFILIGLVSLTALVIMLYWNHATGGRIKPCAGKWRPIGGWREHPSGRSLMGLLGIVCFITMNAAVQALLPPSIPLMVKAAFYFGLYLVFIYALVSIGLTIRNEVRRGRRHQTQRPETGDIAIISKLVKD